MIGEQSDIEPAAENAGAGGEVAIDWEVKLQQDIGSYSQDPLGFVHYAFHWGEGDLAPTPSDLKPGPDEWQREILDDLGKALRAGTIKDSAGVMRYVAEAIQMAVASGHGVGKTALIAWVILWAMATFEECRGIVTANTSTQLRTKTWPELVKWHRRFIAAHWFVVEKTSIHSVLPKYEDTWRIDAVPWDKKNSEAFQGLHNFGKRLLIIFEEAAGIDDLIWEATDGATTDADTEIIWLAFANPTRNKGRFRECWRKFRKSWRTKQVDSRQAKKTNKKVIEQKIRDWGEDSDYIRVRVKGEFPRVGDRQFIGDDLVSPARGRHLREGQYNFAPVIIGVDPAWDGGDETAIYLRQGLMCKKLMVLAKNDDDNIPAGHIARFEDEYNADGVIIDKGWGTGIYSAGKAMKRKWHLVSAAEASPDPGFLNMRAWLWNEGKKWLRDGGAFEQNDEQMAQDFIAPEYITRPDGTIQIEGKQDMRDRGLPSTNRVDALNLTFARPIKKKPRGPARSLADRQKQKTYHPKL